MWHRGTGNSVALRNSGLWIVQRMQVLMSGLLGVQTPREWTGTAGLAAGGVSECCARRIKAGLLVCAGSEWVSSCGGEAGSGATRVCEEEAAECESCCAVDEDGTLQRLAQRMQDVSEDASEQWQWQQWQCGQGNWRAAW